MHREGRKLSYSLHNQMRNTRSLQSLTKHLQTYSKLPKLESQLIAKQEEQKKRISLEEGKSKKVGDKKFEQMCLQLLEKVIFALRIFVKVFNNSRKKKEIIETLYGWDKVFEPLFFHGYDVKAKLDPKSILQQLHLYQENFTTRNIYNKLRFLFYELKNVNTHQQKLQSHYYKQRLTQTSRTLLSTLQGFMSSTKRKQNQKYADEMRKTHLELFQMKMRIKNRGEDFNHLVDGAKKVTLDPFFLEEEKNVYMVEGFVRETLIK